MLVLRARLCPALVLVLAGACLALGCLGCSNGDPGGGDDGGATDGSGDSYRAPVEGVDIDEDFAAFLLQVAELWAGRDADFDGDGVAEVKVTSYDPDGDTTVEYWGPRDEIFAILAPLASFTVNRATGNRQLVLDTNDDGVPEAQTTETGSGREILEDRAGQGTFDWRRTEVFGADGSLTVTLAHLEDSAFVTDAEYTVSRRRPKCGQPNPGGAESKNSTLAPDCLWPMPSAPSGSGGVYVATAGGGGATDHGGFCSNAHQARLFKAIACAKKRFDECLTKWNSEEAARFAEAWATRPLQVDCAIKTIPECRGINAASDETAISVRPPLLDPAASSGLSDEDLCLTMFHEMMHWSGTPDSGNLHGDAVDRVYACARFCDPRCRYDTGVDPDCGTTPGSDCAICVLGKEKNRCGSKTAWVGYGEFYTTNFCAKGTFNPEYADCSAALGPGQVFCDGAIEPDGAFTPCCVACPDGYDNGFACSQWYPDAEEGKVISDAGCRTDCGNPP
ncbi:MAG TPA: hypothetical protein PK668_22980 [Myxococcota bacterium]|nr:hypothetical protein [Myxococcota bacterium]HRY95560.1 hypothetical protein [Myxococcota bacterium]